jgi:hypothetical protein
VLLLLLLLVEEQQQQQGLACTAVLGCSLPLRAYKAISAGNSTLLQELVTGLRCSHLLVLCLSDDCWYLKCGREVPSSW